MVDRNLYEASWYVEIPGDAPNAGTYTAVSWNIANAYLGGVFTGLAASREDLTVASAGITVRVGPWPVGEPARWAGTPAEIRDALTGR